MNIPAPVIAGCVAALLLIPTGAALADDALVCGIEQGHCKTLRTELPEKFFGEWCYADGDAFQREDNCPEEPYTISRNHVDSMNGRYVFEQITQGKPDSFTSDIYIIRTLYYIRSEGTGKLQESPLRSIYLKLKLVGEILYLEELELNEG